MEMADGSSKGIGRIRRNKRREMQQRANHLLYLHLTGVAIANDSHFDFGRGVFMNGNVILCAGQEGHPAGLPQL